MVIRRGQMEVFRAYTLQQFKKRMAARLRRTYPEQTASMTGPQLGIGPSCGARLADAQPPARPPAGIGRGEAGSRDVRLAG